MIIWFNVLGYELRKNTVSLKIYMVQYLTDFIPFRPMEPSNKKQKNVQM